MSALWTAVGVALVAAVFGCSADERTVGKGRGVSDVTDPAEQDDSATESGDTPGLHGLLTNRLEAAYSPAAAGLCAGAPAEVGDMAAWVDARALWLAPRGSASGLTPLPLDRFEPGEVPRSPVSLIANSPDAPALVVAVAGATSCELRIFDRQGGRLGAYTVATPQCTNPSGSGRYLPWPVGDETGADPDASGGKLVWIDVIARRSVATLALGGAPLTPAAAFGSGLVSGGGSHWLVGTTRGIDVIEDPLSRSRLGPGPDPDPELAWPKLVGTWESLEGRVTSIVVAGDYVFVTLAADAEAALGRRIQALRITTVTPGEVVLVASGVPITPPGPMTAHPVTFACAIGVAGSWFCPRDVEATVVAGGEGWVAAWHLPLGDLAFERSVPIAWSGMSLGSDGWIAGGGSHWWPGHQPLGPNPTAGPSWGVIALDPAHDASTLELASASGDRCVPSPLWDDDGTILTPVLGGGPEVVRARISSALGLARGASRPLGDARNSGHAVPDVQACSDGVVRELVAYPLGDETVTAVKHSDGRTVIFGIRSETAFIRWMVGDIAVETDVEDASRIAYALALPNDEVVILYEEKGSGAWRAASYRRSAPRLWSVALDSLVGTPAGLVASVDGTFLTAARDFDGDHVVRFDGVKGTVSGMTIGMVQEPHGVTQFAGHSGGGAFMVVELGSSLALRRVDLFEGHAIRITDEVFFWQGTHAKVGAVDAAVDGNDHLRVLVKERDPGVPEEAWRLLHYDSALTLLDDRPLPFGGSFATAVDGSSLLLGATGPVRIGPTGAFGLPRSLGGGDMAGYSPAPGGIGAMADGFFVAYVLTTDSGRELIAGQADRMGFTSCTDAGLCLGQDANICDIDIACEVSGCVPTTGACESVELPCVLDP